MPHQPPAELISWREVERQCRRLAAAIRDGGFRPQLVVAIGRGGYVPARLLCDALHLMDLTSIKVEHYLAGSTRRREASIRYSLNSQAAAEIPGQRVLLVDDVNDSGDTLALGRQYLLDAGAAEVRCAVMHDKTVSHFRVDYFGKRIVKWRWLIYPWAVVEDITAFSQRLSPAPRDLETLQRCLRQQQGLSISLRTLREIHAVSPLVANP